MKYKELIQKHLGINTPDWIIENVENLIEEAIYLHHYEEINKKTEKENSLKCKCRRAQFSRTVDQDFNPLCGKCGKKI